MEAEEDDDIYAPSEVIRVPPSQDANGQKPADLEEGEQEDEDEEEESDSVLRWSQSSCTYTNSIQGHRHYHRTQRRTQIRVGSVRHSFD